MTFRLGRWVALACVLVCATGTEARADWLITPFLGSAFGGHTNIVNFGSGAEGSKVALGASAAWLGPGILGVEADVGYSPDFFESGGTGSLTAGHSHVLTVVGNAVVTLPIAVTRESLRPYFVVGVGLMNATASDLIGLVPVDRTEWVMDIGGGAIGFLDPSFGVRFDVRRFSVLARDDATGPGIGGRRLSFWRGTVGVTLRY